MYFLDSCDYYGAVFCPHPLCRVFLRRDGRPHGFPKIVPCRCLIGSRLFLQEFSGVLVMVQILEKELLILIHFHQGFFSNFVM